MKEKRDGKKERMKWNRGYEQHAIKRLYERVMNVPALAPTLCFIAMPSTQSWLSLFLFSVLFFFFFWVFFYETHRMQTGIDMYIHWATRLMNLLICWLWKLWNYVFFASVKISILYSWWIAGHSFWLVAFVKLLKSLFWNNLKLKINKDRLGIDHYPRYRQVITFMICIIYH